MQTSSSGIYEELRPVGLIEDRGLSEQVNDLLLEWIAHGRLKPGQRLKETELAEELGVSRTPVREALKGLAAAGFVIAVPRKGVVVSDVETDRLEETLELRYLFEMYAAEGSVERISQDELREMRFLIEECDAIVDSRDRLEYNQYVRRDCDLHRLIIKTGHNALLSELYERLAVFLRIARVRLFESRPDMAKGHEEHKAILEAYERRDKGRLLRLLDSHLRRSSKEFLELARRASAK